MRNYYLQEEELKRDKYLGSYSSFEGSPASQGLLQFDLWGEEPSEEMQPKWNKLKKDIQKYVGIRNQFTPCSYAYSFNISDIIQ